MSGKSSGEFAFVLGSMNQPTADNEQQAEGTKVVSGPLSVIFAADPTVWAESRRLAADKNVRVDDLATCAAQDPVIVMELLKTANAMYYSAGRPPITSAKTAIVRLGSDVTIDTLDKLREREPVEDPELAEYFERHRSRCKRTSIIARMMSESIAKTVADDCQVIGLLLYVGEMVAVVHFGEIYSRIARDNSRNSLNYKLNQEHKFDIDKVCLNYLRRQGIPESLLFALDRDGRSKSQEKAIIKPIVGAAAELVEAFDANRWEKLAPGKNLPPKSPLRMLQIPEAQYLKIYERASEYLFSAKLLEETKKASAAQAKLEGTAPEAPRRKEPTIEQDILQTEIASILQGVPSAVPEPEAVPRQPVVPQAQQQETTITTVNESLGDPSDMFSLTPKERSGPRIKPLPNAKAKAAPKLVSQRANLVVSQISSTMDNAKTSEELLSGLLEMLVDSGPFEKTALIVVSKDRAQAIVVAARGPNIGNGQKLDIRDPLNPLAQCFSKVQSFGNKESPVSPWGSRAFALSPIDADHDTPVALYADCGSNGSITFEARRIFRTVVEILNQKLPTIPGGIPVEL